MRLIYILISLSFSISKANETFIADSSLKKCVDFFSSQTSIPSSALKNICASNSKQLLQFNILTKKDSGSCERTIVLLGEIHTQAAKSVSAGLAITHDFSLIGLENINKSEFEKLKDNSILKQIIIEREQFIAKANKEKSGDGSIIDAAGDRGLLFGFKGTLINKKPLEQIIEKQYHKVPSENWTYFALNLSGGTQLPGLFKQCTKDPTQSLDINFTKATLANSENFIRVFRDFIGKEGFPPVTFNIETGGLDNYNISCKEFDKECMKYVFTERNKRMVRNVNKTMSEVSCGIPLLLVVGAAHVGPLSRMFNLEQYKSFESNPVSPSYKKYNLDPAYPNE